MPPAADLELELRRLGCVDGVLGLLRRRSINESDHVYADRIQLGAALLACKLDLRAAPTKCGATAIAAGRGGAGGDEEGSALTASWGEKALASVLDVVVQGTCSSKVRDILFRLLAKLGRCAIEADVTSQLFDLLSDNYARNDQECCRHVSRALALALHESEDCAKAYAHNEHRVTTLLAIAFPGGRVKILGDHGNVTASSGTVDAAAAVAATASLGSLGAETSIGDYETRENALSCICSIVQADATAVESIQSARGLRPLFVLAMAEEPASGDGNDLSAREGQGNRRRPRTSTPGPRLLPSRRNSTTSTVASFSASDGGSGGHGGIGVKRPMTTGARTPARSPLVPDKAASGSATMADSKAWVERGLSQRGAQATGGDGGGGVSGRGARAFETPDAANPPPPGTATEESTATPSPPPPLREGGLRTAGRGHEAQPAISASSPRAPAVDAIFRGGGGGGGDGGGVTRRDKPLTVLAASILLAGLRGGAHRLATVELGGAGGGGGGAGGGASKQPTGSREGASSGSKRSSGRSTTGRKAGGGGESAAAVAGAESSSRGRVSEQPPPPPGPPHARRRSRKIGRRPQGAGTTTAGAAQEGDGESKGKTPRRARGKRRSLSWRRGRQARGEATIDPTESSGIVPTREPPDLGSTPVGDQPPSCVDGIGADVLNAPARHECRRAERLTALQRLRHGRRGGERTGAVFSELERLGAVQRVPELLDAHCPFQQELGVVILERGIEGLEGGAYVGRGEGGAADETDKQDERKRYIFDALIVTSRHSSVAASTTTKHKRERQQQLVRAGSGASLRSLCWLLLHQRRGVSEGAAAILLALTATLTSTPINTHLKDAIDDAPAAWVVLDLVEQGCVPILRMAGGGVAPSTLEAEVEGGCGGIVSRQAARVILEAVVTEACGRHAGRLVRSVMSSGSRKLRANVALGLTVLSAGTGGVLGKQAWESFVTGGALPAVLGMLRSPTGRPAAVSFLRTVSALLGGDPAPQNIFSDGVVYYEGKGGGYSRDGRTDGGGWCLAGPSGSADEEEDTVVLVVDPLACLEGEKGISSDRGEHTEEEGIKMACPPRKVICRASTRLRDVIINTPAGELPLLRGRYRTWEEVMAHMGAPHTFNATGPGYSIEFLMEMFVLAATFSIEDQANGYAHELLRRLGLPLAGGDGSETPTTRSTPTTLAAAELSSKDPIKPLKDAGSTSSSIETGGSDTTKGAAGIGAKTVRHSGECGEPLPRDGTEQAEGENPFPRPSQAGTVEDENRDISDGSGGNRSSSSSGISSSSKNGGRHRADSTVFAVLEGGLRCRHDWLCAEAFREASATIGSGDGEGLPPSPRELTALVGLLQQVVSNLRVAAEGQREE